MSAFLQNCRSKMKCVCIWKVLWYIICLTILVSLPLAQFLYRLIALLRKTETLFETPGVVLDSLLMVTYLFTIIGIFIVLRNNHGDRLEVHDRSREDSRRAAVNNEHPLTATTDTDRSSGNLNKEHACIPPQEGAHRIHGHSLLPKVLLFILGCGDALFNITRFGDQLFIIIYSDYENDHCKQKINVSIAENFFRSLSQLSILFFMLADEKKKPQSPFLHAFIRILPISMLCQYIMIIMQEVDSHMRHHDVCTKLDWNMSHSFNNTEDYLYPLGTEFRSFAFMELFIIAITIGEKYQHKVKATSNLLKSDKSQTDQSDSDSHIPFARIISGIGVLIVIFSIAFIMFQERYYEEEKNSIILFSEIFEVSLVTILLFLTIASFVCGCKQKNITPVPWNRRKVIELIALGLAWLSLVVYSALTLYGACKYDTNNRIEIHTRKLTIAASILSLFQSSLQLALIFCATRRKRYFSASMSKVWIIGSFAMWLFDSFSAKKYSTNVIQLEAYGHTGWIYLGAIFIPLSIFFRFHSCIVLAHMN